MGIDPIGKAGGPGSIAPAAITGADGVDSIDAPEEFSIGGANKVADVEATSPLDKLQAGEIDLSAYLDLRVDQATAHLVDRVDGERLAFIRSSLRSQLEQDPALVDLVRRATGATQGALNRG